MSCFVTNNYSSALKLPEWCYHELQVEKVPSQNCGTVLSKGLAKFP